MPIFQTRSLIRIRIRWSTADDTSLAFPGNIIPASRLDPVALKIQSLVPMPQTGALVNNLLPVFPTDRNTNIPALKIDELLSSRDKLSFYWSQTNTEASSFSIRPATRTDFRSQSLLQPAPTFTPGNPVKL